MGARSAFSEHTRVSDRRSTFDLRSDTAQHHHRMGTTALVSSGESAAARGLSLPSEGRGECSLGGATEGDSSRRPPVRGGPPATSYPPPSSPRHSLHPLFRYLDRAASPLQLGPPQFIVLINLRQTLTDLPSRRPCLGQVKRTAVAFHGKLFRPLWGLTLRESPAVVKFGRGARNG
jgi:hypothetical protein